MRGEAATIVAATDLGESGGRVVDQAAVLAEAVGARLRLVTVCDAGDDDAPWEGASGIAPALEAMRARLREKIEEKADLLERERLRCEARGLECDAELLEGRPWEALVEHATRVEAALLVVGAHGADGGGALAEELRERLLSSTTDRVVRYSPCPVLVVCTRREPRPDLRGRRWLVGIDLSDASLHALDVARGWIARTGGELLLMHVVPPVGVETEGEGGWQDTLDRHRRADAAARLEGLLTSPPEGTHEERVERVALGAPADELCHAVDDLGADVLVVGTHGRSGIRRFLLGSTAERCLRKARVPVLVVRPPEGAAS